MHQYIYCGNGEDSETSRARMDMQMAQYYVIGTDDIGTSPSIGDTVFLYHHTDGTAMHYAHTRFKVNGI